MVVVFIRIKKVSLRRRASSPVESIALLLNASMQPPVSIYLSISLWSVYLYLFVGDDLSSGFFSFLNE